MPSAAFDRVRKLSGVRSRRLYEGIAEQIRGLILEKQLVPGDRLPAERDLAGLFGVSRAFQAGDSVRVLSFVFDRLYVLRNQLVHGASTWNSRGRNRAQVRDGAAILAFLLPVFMDLMMDNPQEDWGRPFYPVIE